MLKGIDVSAFQGEIDWHAVKAAGCLFAFAKATEGVSWVDPQFARNWEGMRAAALHCGAYHFYHPADGPTAQAQHFCRTFTLEKGDLPPVIDVEKQGLSPTLYAQGLRACLKEVEALCGMKPLIYCSPGWWDTHLTGDFSDWGLWCAHYTHAPNPNLPHGWSRYQFWQYSSSGQIPGIHGSVDLDRFSGELSALESMTKK